MKITVVVTYEEHIDSDETIRVDYQTEPRGQYIGNVPLAGVLSAAAAQLSIGIAENGEG